MKTDLETESCVNGNSLRCDSVRFDVEAFETGARFRAAVRGEDEDGHGDGVVCCGSVPPRFQVDPGYPRASAAHELVPATNTGLISDGVEERGVDLVHPGYGSGSCSG